MSDSGLTALPLLGRVDERGYYAPPSEPDEKRAACGSGVCGCGAGAAATGAQTVARIRAFGFDLEPKIPTAPLLPGEQYRFHFDANRCIGCECCVVACNEQNGNPAEVNWRRVGEIEGGKFPHVRRFYLSMGCNHCLDPACLEGCPTGAYTKDTITGIVRHEADSCIGCQYCMWNCPYGVPQFNPERRIVTKCDMCYGRLKEGREPACVAACPEQAIRIEKVNVAAWRAEHAEADAPGMPDSNHTISTTRITLPRITSPDGTPANFSAADAHRIEPEHPHTPLIFLLTLTQLSVGGFLALWLADLARLFGHPLLSLQRHLGVTAMGMFLMAGLALNSSIFHLGRPAHAWKAIRMWRRSWLSREVVFFGAFSGFAGLYVSIALLPLASPILDLAARTLPPGAGGLIAALRSIALLPVPYAARLLLGTLVAVSGIAGVVSSAKIYMVPARPSWNTPRTMVRFFGTALILGPLFAATLVLGCEAVLAGEILVQANIGTASVRGAQIFALALLGLAALGAAMQVLSLGGSIVGLGRSGSAELRGTALLLTRRFRRLFIGRLAALVAGGIFLPAVLMPALYGHAASITALFAAALVGFLLALAGEFVGRYLFFVTVVPKNMAGAFFRS